MEDYVSVSRGRAVGGLCVSLKGECSWVFLCVSRGSVVGGFVSVSEGV